MRAQAWFDTIRMMRRAGGYDSEWRALAKRKLSAEQQRELDNWTRDTAQLIVLEHKGLAPHRKEMNLLLSLNSRSEERRVGKEWSTWGAGRRRETRKVV